MPESLHTLTPEDEANVLSQLYLALNRERQQHIIAMVREMSEAWAVEKCLGKKAVMAEIKAAVG
jgi:hypothetical protein